MWWRGVIAADGKLSLLLLCPLGISDAEPSLGWKVRKTVNIGATVDVTHLP